MDIDDLERKLGIDGLSADEQMLLVDALQKSAQSKLEIANQEAIGKSTEVVIQGLKKIKSDLETRFSQLNATIQSKASSLRDGKDGKDGKNGKDGLEGKQGLQGINGQNGRDGRDGVDGIDGVSVTSARIDFDGSLVISLSSGVELNVGEVVAPDLAESIKVITNGGGTSQFVLDTLTSLQTQINTLIPSQTGNSGKFLTTNGTSTSWATVSGSGGLSYQGTWNATTNTPTLASSTGTNGYYYIVATAGSTNLNGITDWQVGDWLLFNGSVWQKIDQSEVLQSITSTDGSVTVTTTGSTADLSVAVAASTTNVICLVRNTTGATLTKGTVVYISGATGQNPTVTKAQANNDTNSAQTLGVMSADLANNSNGYVTIIGLVTGMDTSAYTDGAQLYLSPTTAGTYTTTKPHAPDHLVYVAIVEHAHPTQGKLFVKVQNGYELDELHNVSAQSPSNGQTIIYNATTSLWEKGTLTAGTGISVSNGAGSITVTNSSPDQTVALTGAGTTSITGTYPNFTITSNDAYTGTVTSVTGTSPVASSGGATPAISLSSGYGDTLNPYASKTANYVLASPNGTAGVPTFRALVATDVPTLNQNTTGTAANITATSNSTLTTLSVLSLPYSQLSGTVPTWNQNTTGSAATLTTPRAIYGNNFDGSAALTGVIASTYGGTGNGFAKFTGPLTAEKTFTLPNASATILTDNAAVTVLQGGTGATTASGARTNLGLVIGTDVLAPTGSAASLTGFPTFNQNTTGTASNVTGTVAIANGGTGQTTQQSALNALAGAVTSAYYARGNGTNVVMSAIQAADVPTLNQNTTGTASNVTGTVAVANGGTGVTTSTGSGNTVLSTSPTLVTPILGTPTSATLTNATGLPLSTGVTGTLPIANGGTGLTTTPANGALDIGNGTGFTRTTLTAGSNITITNGAGSISIAATSGGGTTWQSVKTADFTAVSTNGYPINTTSGVITATLPASPTAGDYVIFTDYAGTWNTNAVTVSPNGGKINGSTSNKVLAQLRESISFVYIDATQGWLAYSGFQDAIPTNANYSASYLIAAGGGGGGSGFGGGGGAGGLRTGSSALVIGTVYTITVGAGGAGTTSAANTTGTSGSNSTFNSITSTGGGGGSGYDAASTGLNGGSGGGSGVTGGVGPAGTPGTGTSGQGNNGGQAWQQNTFAGNSGGGGGGAGAVGASAANGVGGNGGIGVASSITGTSIYYCGGGGGGSGTTVGTGGSGGGGGGAITGVATAGTVNTGGGGGSSSNTFVVGQGAAGGSGVVILSVPTASYSGTSTGSPTITTSGSNTILKFTASGTYTA